MPYRRDRSERGAAVIEFAIVLPILILLVFGIVQFSIVYNRVQGLHAAAREAARLVVPTPDHAVRDQRSGDGGARRCLAERFAERCRDALIDAAVQGPRQARA